MALQSQEGDSVAVLIDSASAGDVLCIRFNDSITELVCQEDIPVYHKVAIKPIAPQSKVLRCGVAIGKARGSIEVGSLVHVHNIESLRARGATP